MARDQHLPQHTPQTTIRESRYTLTGVCGWLAAARQVTNQSKVGRTKQQDYAVHTHVHMRAHTHTQVL